MTGYMNILLCNPGQDPLIEAIPDSLEGLQKAVGGYIEWLRIDSNAGILCDEDGKRKKLPFNRFVCGQPIVGTFIVVGIKGTNYRSLSEEEIRLYSDMFTE
jgi:hypothetical protein